MTHPAGKIEATLATPFGLRTWLEDGFKHAQDDLGWADYRVSDFARIEGWGEVVMSAYPLLSLQSAEFAARGHLTP